MKKALILAILLITLIGCSNSQQELQPEPAAAHAVSGTQDLILSEQDLQELGMAANTNKTYLEQIGITDTGTNCWTDDAYSNIVDSSTGQYTICGYTILDDTDVVIELKKFENYEALNGSYQYDTSHLFGAKGLISENDFGDQSRFRVNSEDDYGAEFNEPGVYFYHLWFTKGLYIVHITSGGTSQEAEETIAETGRLILAKFG